MPSGQPPESRASKSNIRGRASKSHPSEKNSGPRIDQFRSPRWQQRGSEMFSYRCSLCKFPKAQTFSRAVFRVSDSDVDAVALTPQVFPRLALLFGPVAAEELRRASHQLRELVGLAKPSRNEHQNKRVQAFGLRDDLADGQIEELAGVAIHGTRKPVVSRSRLANLDHQGAEHFHALCGLIVADAPGVRLVGATVDHRLTRNLTHRVAGMVDV